jgi:predicted TIM-barrel fold metal-dependent hydrolase
MIIDIHTHPHLDRPFETMQEIIRSAQKVGIDKLCLLGDVLYFGYKPTPDQIRDINDSTIALVNRQPDTLIGFCFLNPAHKKEFILEEIDRCVIGEDFKGIKLEVAVNARDERLNPIMERAQALRIPVLHHSWYKVVDKTPNESDPSDIADLASRFPEVNIIMAHLSGGGIRGILDIKPFPNVYVDTSGSQPISGVVEYAVETLGAERILFGSDVPGRDFSSQLGRIYGAKISERHRRLILGINAQQLLGIK